MADIKSMLGSKNYVSNTSLGKGTLCNSYDIMSNNNRNKFFAKEYVMTEISSVISSQTTLKQILDNEVNILNKANVIADVVKYVDSIFSQQSFVLIFEFLSVPTLKQQIITNKGMLQYDPSLILLHQIVKCINNIHNMILTHHNLKPSNILLLNNNNIKISDINLGYNIADKSHYQQIARNNFTLQYIAPEVFTNSPINNKVDIWSIGIITLEMLFGINKTPLQEIINSCEKTITHRIESNDIMKKKSNYKLLVDLLVKTLNTDINQRISSNELLNHALFKTLEVSNIITKVNVTPLNSTNQKQVVTTKTTKVGPRTNQTTTTVVKNNSKTTVVPNNNPPALKSAPPNSSVVKKGPNGTKVVTKGPVKSTVVKSTVVKSVNKGPNTVKTVSSTTITETSTVISNNITTNNITTNNITTINDNDIIAPKPNITSSQPINQSTHETQQILHNNEPSIEQDTSNIISNLITSINNHQKVRREAVVEYLEVTNRHDYFPNDDEARNRLMDAKEILDLNGLSFTNKTVHFLLAFFDILKLQSQLIELHCFMCLFDEKQLRLLSTALPYLVKLRKLDLSNNCLNDEFALSLSGCFKFWPELDLLKLSSNGDDNDNYKIHDNGFSSISTNLISLPKLETFHFNGHNFTKISFTTFCNSLKSIPKIKDLKLGDNKITDEELSLLIPCFKSITQLEELELRGSEITNIGLKQLLSSLDGLPNLKMLYLHKNLGITDDILIQAAITKYKKIKILSDHTDPTSFRKNDLYCSII